MIRTCRELVRDWDDGVPFPGTQGPNQRIVAPSHQQVTAFFESGSVAACSERGIIQLRGVS